MQAKRGFTLIELIIVIVLLGVLAVTAAPKFLNLRDDANASVVQGVGSAFKTSINLVHFKWQAKGGSGPIDNLELYGPGQPTLDINGNGWPVQSWPPFEGNPLLDNVNDCISIWNTILTESAPSVSASSGTDYQASYTSGTCTFTLVEQPAFSIFYNADNGNVTIDTTL